MVMSWLKDWKREAKKALRDIEFGLTEGMIADPYHGSPLLISAPPSTLSLPFTWYGPETLAKPVPLPRHEVSAAASALGRAMDRHEREILQSSIKLVCLYRGLAMNGVWLGGTCDISEGTIYLTCCTDEPGWEETLAMTFHHEAAHQILWRHKAHWAEEAWVKLNPPGFAYGEGGVQAIQAGRASLNASHKWLEKGFLNEYSTASAEEDFCCVCHELFLGHPEFWEALPHYPRLEAKAKLAITFFRHLHSGYSEERFRSFARKNAG